jgi:hypothetical protein
VRHSPLNQREDLLDLHTMTSWKQWVSRPLRVGPPLECRNEGSLSYLRDDSITPWRFTAATLNGFIHTVPSFYIKFPSKVISNHLFDVRWREMHVLNCDRLCGLMVRLSGYRSRGSRFDSRPYQIFWEVGCLERGPLNLVRTIEELLGWKK